MGCVGSVLCNACFAVHSDVRRPAPMAPAEIIAENHEFKNYFKLTHYPPTLNSSPIWLTTVYAAATEATLSGKKICMLP